VKYRKALLEDDVVEIIMEVTRGLAERYDMEFERFGLWSESYLSAVFRSSEDCAGANCARVQEYQGTRIVSAEAGLEERAVGRGVVVWWLLYGEGGNWQVVERYVQQQGKPAEELRQLTLF